MNGERFLNGEELFVLVLLSAIVAGVFLIVMALRQRAQSQELIHRERMAMIERGLVPPPEMNPAHAVWGPERALHVARSLDHRAMGGDRGGAAPRPLTLGIVVVAIGLGFMTLVGVASREPEVGLGVGGAISIIGLAFIIIGLVRRNVVTTHEPERSFPVARQSSEPSPPPDLPV